MLKEHEKEAEERKQELAKKIVDLEHALEEQQRVEDLMNKDSDEEEQVVSNPMFESGDGSPASGKGGSDEEGGGDEEGGKGAAAAAAPGTPQGKWAAKAKQAGLE